MTELKCKLSFIASSKKGQERERDALVKKATYQLMA